MTTLSMYAITVPRHIMALQNLDTILDKAVAWADTRKIDHNALLLARLAPDMYPLIKQVQIATDMAKGCAARLAGVEVPKYEDTEATFADLKARLAKTIAFLQSFKPEQINGSEGKQIVLKFGPVSLEYSGLDYAITFATWNVLFHVTTAYNILRHNGLDIGKRDFMGG